MKHQEELQSLGVWRILQRNKGVAVNLVLYLAVAQNLILLLRFSTHSDHAILRYVEPIANKFFGVIQCLSCVTVFLLYTLQNGPLRQQKLWKRHHNIDFDEVKRRAFSTDIKDKEWFILLLVKGPYFLLTDFMLVFSMFMFVAAVLGLWVHPFWFSVHLLDIVNKSADLQNVFTAVTLNGRSILMTALFGVIIIYLYAIVGFAFLQEWFVIGDYPDPDIPVCPPAEEGGLLVCWASALNEGLRAGDIGAFSDPAKAVRRLHPVRVHLLDDRRHGAAQRSSVSSDTSASSAAARREEVEHGEHVRHLSVDRFHFDEGRRLRAPYP